MICITRRSECIEIDGLKKALKLCARLRTCKTNLKQFARMIDHSYSYLITYLHTYLLGNRAASSKSFLFKSFYLLLTIVLNMFFPKLKKGFFAESWVWVCTLTSGQTRRRRLLLRSPPPSRSTSSGARSSFPPFDISLWLFCNVETLCDFLQQHFRLIRLFLLIHIQSFVLDGSWYLA